GGQDARRARAEEHEGAVAGESRRAGDVADKRGGGVVDNEGCSGLVDDIAMKRAVTAEDAQDPRGRAVREVAEEVAWAVREEDQAVVDREGVGTERAAEQVQLARRCDQRVVLSNDLRMRPGVQHESASNRAGA